MKRSRIVLLSFLIVLATREWGRGLLLSSPPVAAPYSNITNSQIQANWTDNQNGAGTSYNAIESISPSPSTNGLGSNQTVNTANLFAVFTGLSPNTLYYVDVNATAALSLASGYTSLGSVATLANIPTSASPTNIQTNQITANWGANGNP